MSQDDMWDEQPVPDTIIKSTHTIKTMCPELSEAQRLYLYREIRDGVVGADNRLPHTATATDVRNYETRDDLRAEQLKALSCFFCVEDV